MSLSPMDAARAFRVRFDEKSDRHGIIYPWWIGFVSKVLIVGCAVIALGQRGILSDPTWASVSLLLVLTPLTLQFSIDAWVPWWFTTAFIVAASVVLMLASDGIGGATDFAPAILLILVAEITATDGWKAGLVTVAVSLIAIVTLMQSEAVIPALEVLLGFVAGSMLWWQTRALVAERTARTGERARATLAERQRIAHEIHDLVAHSLSVTLLHVTGARRALEQDEDIPEAVAALVDAERIGRQAMADIRRTVGILASETSDTRSLPDAKDVEGLVADFQAAGLRVTYDEAGQLEALPAGAGLGFYRIVQESLTNIAKHAPNATARVTFHLGAGRATLAIRNTLPAHQPARDGLGSGIAGMASRADQLDGTLRAGPEGGDWLVEAVIPFEDEGGMPHACPVRKKSS